MNKQEKQYYRYLINLGYSPVFCEEKSSFLLREEKIYLKCCEYPASEKTKALAIQHSLNRTIILLEGNLTFRDYPVYSGGELMDMAVLMCKDSKYAPFYYCEYNDDYYDDERIAIARAITEKQLVCRRCNRVDQYKVSKNIHYKATCVCGAFITNLSTNKPITIHFGKYIGRELTSMTSKEEIQYLQWGINSGAFSKKLTEAAIEFIK